MRRAKEKRKKRKMNVVTQFHYMPIAYSTQPIKTQTHIKNIQHFTFELCSNTITPAVHNT